MYKKSKIKKYQKPLKAYERIAKSYKGSAISMTQKDQGETCDINHIMSQYIKTGEISSINGKQPKYGHFSNATDYTTALQNVIDANEDFMSLPSKIRDQFANDPAELLKFMEKATKEQMIEKGLIKEVKKSNEVISAAKDTSDLKSSKVETKGDGTGEANS